MKKLSKTIFAEAAGVWFMSSAILAIPTPFLYIGSAYDKGFLLNILMSFGILFLLPFVLFAVFLIVMSPYLAWNSYRKRLRKKQKDYDDFVAMCRGDKK